MFVVVAIVIFGIFVGMSYLIFGDTMQPTLENIFKDGTTLVEKDSNVPPVLEEKYQLPNNILAIVHNSYLSYHVEVDAIAKTNSAYTWDRLRITGEDVMTSEERTRYLQYTAELMAPQSLENVNTLITHPSILEKYPTITTANFSEFLTAEDMGMLYDIVGEKLYAEGKSIKDFTDTKTIEAPAIGLTDIRFLDIFKDVKMINISGNNVSDITPLLELTNPALINISMNPKLTQADADALQEKFPEADILF